MVKSLLYPLLVYRTKATFIVTYPIFIVMYPLNYVKISVVPFAILILPFACKILVRTLNRVRPYHSAHPSYHTVSLLLRPPNRMVW